MHWEKIRGPLPTGHPLAHPIVVGMEHEEGEWVVWDAVTYIHGSGETEEEALKVFARILVGTRDFLTRREPALGNDLRGRLEWLREILGT